MKLIGAPLHRGRFATGNEAGFHAHDVRKRQAGSIFRIENLHLKNFAAACGRNKTDASVGEGAVYIHKKKLDFFCALKERGRPLWID